MTNLFFGNQVLRYIGILENIKRHFKAEIDKDGYNQEE